MTGVVLFLTALPLAAILALLLNTLLDRKTASATESTAAPNRSKPFPGPSTGALLAALLLASAALVGAETARAADCTSLECSLEADAAAVEELWSNSSNGQPVIVAQSRIPVRVDAFPPSSTAASDALIAEKDSGADNIEASNEPAADETP